jgi:hypothetical protein
MMAAKADKVFVAANNHPRGQAAANAVELQGLLSGQESQNAIITSSMLIRSLRNSPLHLNKWSVIRTRSRTRSVQAELHLPLTAQARDTYEREPMFASSMLQRRLAQMRRKVSTAPRAKVARNPMFARLRSMIASATPAPDG